MEERDMRKTRIGTVVSDKMEKTVVVAVERLIQHGTYGRRMKRSATYKAHNENNEARLGDKVAIMETRPLSHDKRWRVVEIVEKAK